VVLFQLGGPYSLDAIEPFLYNLVETLHEINIEAREMAETLGILQFETMGGLNDSPSFIAALADLVLRKVTVKVPG
jgi:ferrochelatase